MHPEVLKEVEQAQDAIKLERKLKKRSFSESFAVKVTGKVWEGEKYPTINLVVSQVCYFFLVPYYNYLNSFFTDVIVEILKNKIMFQIYSLEESLKEFN